MDEDDRIDLSASNEAQYDRQRLEDERAQQEFEERKKVQRDGLAHYVDQEIGFFVVKRLDLLREFKMAVNSDTFTDTKQEILDTITSVVNAHFYIKTGG